MELGLPGSLAHTCGLGDNAGMARDDSRAQLRRVELMLLLDGARPSGASGWVSAVAPVVTQAAVGGRGGKKAHGATHIRIDVWTINRALPAMSVMVTRLFAEERRAKAGPGHPASHGHGFGVP